MTTTHILENQVENLPESGYTTSLTGEDSGERSALIRRSDVIDLIRGFEEDLYDMEDQRALEEAHDLLYEKFYDIDDALIDIAQQRDPLTDFFLGIFIDQVVEDAEDYQDDLEYAMDTISKELEQLE